MNKIYIKIILKKRTIEFELNIQYLIQLFFFSLVYLGITVFLLAISENYFFENEYINNFISVYVYENLEVPYSYLKNYLVYDEASKASAELQPINAEIVKTELEIKKVKTEIDNLKDTVSILENLLDTIEKIEADAKSKKK